MSQPNERSSEKTNSTDEEKQSENQSDTTMLEDEEMPTYTSLSSPTRREDTDGESTVLQRQRCGRTPAEEDQDHSPNASDDQGGGSIYVVSSGDETDHQAYEDEEDDDYEDLDDVEDERRNMMLEEEEDEIDEEDEDDDPIRLHDVDTEEDYDVDSERASDDFLLQRNRPLRNSFRARSLSLQDLTSCKNHTRVPYPRKRYSLDMTTKHDSGYSQYSRAYSNMYKRPPVPVQYRHVESKVKQYIMNIREQNRRFVEKRTEEQEYVRNKHHLETSYSKNNAEDVKPTTMTTNAKDYVMKVIKELENEENYMDGKPVYNTAHILQNGKDGEVNITLNQQKITQKDIPMDVHYETKENDRNTLHGNENNVKRNGTMESNAQDHILVVPVEKQSKNANANNVQTLNGYEQTVNNIGTRTLSYEEYMYNNPNSSQKDINIITQENNQIDSEIVNVEIDGNDAGYSLRIENVKSIQTEHIDSVDHVNHVKFTKTNDESTEIARKDMEIKSLKAQLEKKNVQFNTLQDTYQKSLTENLKMKQELDDMRKALAKYEKDSQRPETKVAEVQTEPLKDSVIKQEPPKIIEQTVNKLGKKPTRIESTSSIEQWTDSPCSIAISMKSPDVTAFSDSDSSFIGANKITPRRTGRPLSKAFITSSRILQTLSNITHGKSKPESPLVRDSGKLRTDSTTENEKEYNNSTEFASPVPGLSSNGKKRKATDMLGASSFSQPFKIPHTSSEWRKKIIESRAESKEHVALNSQSSASTSNYTSNTKNSINAENNFEQSEDEDDPEDKVKCFVYHEDENSKERSFLIQAEESTKEVPNDKSRIRECGPYLLGNVEVRMSEVNGTINIWGKEVSQDSMTEEDNETETCKKPAESKQYQHWQNHDKFNGSQIVCSTSKKPKMPPRYDANLSDCSDSPFLSKMKMSFSMDDISERQRGNQADPADFTVACVTCGSPKIFTDLRTSAGPSSPREQVQQTAGGSARQCCCAHKREKQRHDNQCGCIKEKPIPTAHRRFSLRSPIEAIKRSYKNNASAAGETTCKHHKTTRRSLSAFDDVCRHDAKYNTFKHARHACERSSGNAANFHNSNCCNNHLSDKDEEDPLIPIEQRGETPETRQRRLRGKRVRALVMDLLRGCGDCHNDTTLSATENTREKQQSSSCRRSCPPQIKVSPCTPPSCGNPTEPHERCCCAYALSIESELTKFRQDMERVRSRSDAILDMLNMLQSPDMN